MNKVDRVLLESPFSREPGMRNASTGSGLVEVAVQDPRERNFKDPKESENYYLWKRSNLPEIMPVWVWNSKGAKALENYHFLWRRTHFITALVEVPGQVTVSEKDIASDEEIKKNYNKKAPKEKPEAPKRNDDVFKFPYEGVMPRKEKPSSPAEIERIRGEFIENYSEFLEAGGEISDRIVREYLRVNPWDSNGKTINYMCGAAVKIVRRYKEHLSELVIYVYWDEDLNTYSAKVDIKSKDMGEDNVVVKKKWGTYHQSCIHRIQDIIEKRLYKYNKMRRRYVFYREGSMKSLLRPDKLERLRETFCCNY